MTSRTTVRAYPRMHMSLIDLGKVTDRAYGGIGFSVDGLPIVVSGTSGPVTTFRSNVPLDDLATRECEAAIARAAAKWRLDGISVEVNSMPPQHVGFGTKTALILAVLKVVSLLANVKARKGVLQRLAGRGGASGVGVHAFFMGGFLVDGGHRQTEDPLVPSSARTPSRVPPLNARHAFPRPWVVDLLLPSGKRVFGNEEREFFATHTPMGREDVLSTLAIVYHRLLPAIAEVTFDDFRLGVAALHGTGFKRHEVQAQPVHVQALLTDLLEHASVAAGMSSLGPLIYAVTRRTDKVARRDIQALCNRHDARVLGTFEGRNAGFEVASA